MQEKNLIPTWRNKAGSKEEAAFDMGLEEGAELQDRKLGGGLWPLWTEYIVKVSLETK